MAKTLDVITIGRSSVDLYGSQVGGRLEDMGSFQKYVGGSPLNMACGTARLGLRSALLTRVGDEHMGRFVREELAREGVDVRGVATDPERLTALVILGIRGRESFPLIFYRTDCADMALGEDDVDPSLIAEARSVVATGTHLSHPRTEAAVLKPCASRERAAPRPRSTSTTAPTSGASQGTGQGSRASSRARR
jgi:5-dehydro-2-deoxygluconokinase